MGKLGEFSSKEYCFDITPHSEKRPKKVSMITGLVKNEKDCQARHPCYQNETEQEDAINIAFYQRLNKTEEPYSFLFVKLRMSDLNKIFMIRLEKAIHIN